MKVIMIGTRTCGKCKSIAPRLEEYCSNHSIEYKYVYAEEAPADILDILTSNSVRQAPAFLIYMDNGESKLLTGDSIFVELESLNP